MKRREFVSAVGLTAAAATLAACGQQECESSTTASTAANKKQKPEFEWKLVTSWPKNYPGLGTAPENFAKLVERMSAGRLKIKVLGANELVPAMQTFDTVSLGRAEMAHCAAYYWKGKAPAAQFFTAVPFGMTAQEMNGWFHYGGGLALWRELYDRFNLVPFAGGSTGVQMAGWFNKEINNVDDLRGLKMRIPGLGGEILKKAGGTPVTLPGSDLFTSLQRGAIDATEWVGPYNDLAFGLHKAAQYYYYPGWHEPGAMLEFIVNKDAYAGLPADLQAIVEGACRAINQDMLDEYTARNNAALDELVNTHKVDLRALPDEVTKTLKTMAEESVWEVAKHDELSQRVFDSFRGFAEGVKKYHKISEQAYLSAREV